MKFAVSANWIARRGITSRAAMGAAVPEEVSMLAEIEM
jgi:hypothetical protein